MELSTMFCLCASFLFIVLFRALIKPYYVSKRRDLPLPPGSMGWPYIGETFQMYSQDPNVFFASKIKRFGSMFKSHILGCPCVMISSPEAAKFVLNKAQLFKPTFPASKERMLGKQAIFFHQGEYHANLRRLVLRTFMPEAIKNIVPDIESIAQDCLKSWEGRLITTFLEMKTEEQECILKSKEESGEDKGLNWEDAKKMPITSRVIQETLRVASILSFTFREAVEDVEYQGYLIPKGWKVLPLFRNIHHSPDNFKEPEKFDPSRFEAAPKPNTFMPFGSGIHMCPGNELAKLEILVLLHHLTTKYRWSVVGAKNGIQYGPFALPQNGLPITLFPKSK
ncbi:hypothetical protein GLYMA_01G153300v4 [Glycine max]|nr:hypothetical protein GLYMA_01G153300v4 [Glycine max]KAH1163233.1 hypothetical protein GYH30_001663 [Glycine max]